MDLHFLSTSAIPQRAPATARRVGPAANGPTSRPRDQTVPTIDRQPSRTRPRAVSRDLRRNSRVRRPALPDGLTSNSHRPHCIGLAAGTTQPVNHRGVWLQPTSTHGSFFALAIGHRPSESSTCSPPRRCRGGRSRPWRFILRRAAPGVQRRDIILAVIREDRYRRRSGLRLDIAQRHRIALGRAGLTICT